METFITYLESLKNSVPVNCTVFNVQRLKINYTDFKNLLASLPEQMSEIKDNFLQRLEILKLKIDEIETNFTLSKRVFFAFQEATVQLKAQMNAVILSLQSGNIIA